MHIPLRQIRRTLGWQGIVGLTLIGAALVVDFQFKRPLEKRLQAAESMLAANARRSLGALSGGTGDLSRFQTYFRDGGDVTGSLAIMYDIADEKGLKLNSADYSVRQDKDLGIEGYEVVFPVTGTYSRVREFAQTVLDKLPVASLDQIRINRKRVSDVLVDAELRFTFYHVPR